MCEMMFRDLVVKNQVMVDDIECDIEHNYTYEIIDYFHSNEDDYIKDDFWWIITGETLEEIVNNGWVNSEQLLKNNKFLILMSSKDNSKYINELSKHCKYSKIIKLKGNFDYHSSDIREKYKNGNLQVLDYTNQEVKRYIIDNKLYLE
jgi:nicotinic acid mononucleotide adenylyltransferase